MASPTTAAHKRDASLDIDRSEAPAPKSAKVMGEADASIHVVASATQLPSLNTNEDVAGDETPEDEASESSHANSENVASTSTAVKGKGKREEKSFENASSADSSSTLKEHMGDLFAAPDNTVLVHACNTVGSWGGGIAAAFRTRYPKAYQIYNSHCVKNHDPKTNPVPTGTCLLIPPCETKPGAPKHWIGCLFTSAKYGRAKDPPHVILRHTLPAFKDLLAQLDRETAIQEVRMCQINAGLFAVPWSDTKKAVEDVLATHGSQTEVHVYTPANASASSTFLFGGRNFVKKPPAVPLSRGRTAIKGQPAKRQPEQKAQPAKKGSSAAQRQVTLNSFVIRKQERL